MCSWIIYTNCFCDVFIPFSLCFFVCRFVTAAAFGGGRLLFLPRSAFIALHFIQICLKLCSTLRIYCCDGCLLLPKWLMVENSSSVICCLLSVVWPHKKVTVYVSRTSSFHQIFIMRTYASSQKYDKLIFSLLVHKSWCFFFHHLIISNDTLI